MTPLPVKQLRRDKIKWAELSFLGILKMGFVFTSKLKDIVLYFSGKLTLLLELDIETMHKKGRKALL